MIADIFTSLLLYLLAFLTYGSGRTEMQGHLSMSHKDIRVFLANGLSPVNGIGYSVLYMGLNEKSLAYRLILFRTGRRLWPLMDKISYLRPI